MKIHHVLLAILFCFSGASAKEANIFPIKFGDVKFAKLEWSVAAPPSSSGSFYTVTVELSGKRSLDFEFFSYDWENPLPDGVGYPLKPDIQVDFGHDLVAWVGRLGFSKSKDSLGTISFTLQAKTTEEATQMMETLILLVDEKGVGQNAPAPPARVQRHRPGSDPARGEP